MTFYYKKIAHNKFQDIYKIISNSLLIMFLIAIIYPIVSCELNLNIKCRFKEKYNRDCISCGLTRGFNECLKGNFKMANKYNSFSTFLFFWANSQILIRLIVMYKQFNKRMLIPDMLLAISPIIVMITLKY